MKFWAIIWLGLTGCAGPAVRLAPVGPPSPDQVVWQAVKGAVTYQTPQITPVGLTVHLTWQCANCPPGWLTGLAASTNLALPLTNWQILCQFPATNQCEFDQPMSALVELYIAFNHP